MFWTPTIMNSDWLNVSCFLNLHRLLNYLNEVDKPLTYITRAVTTTTEHADAFIRSSMALTRMPAQAGRTTTKH